MDPESNPRSGGSPSSPTLKETFKKIFVRKKKKNEGKSSEPQPPPEQLQPEQVQPPPLQPNIPLETQPQPTVDIDEDVLMAERVDWEEVLPNDYESSSEEEEVELEEEDKPKPARTGYEDLEGMDLNLKGEEAKKRYENLLQKKFENTHSIDLTVLDKLGIKEDFYRLTKAIGFSKKFWKIHEKAYTRLTMEFLCTLELYRDSKSGLLTMDFRVNGKNRYINEKRFGEIFGLEQGTIEDEIFEKDLWEDISLEKGVKDNMKRSSHIQHPTIRFIQRMLSLTIFAKGESGNKLIRAEQAVINQIFFKKGDAKLNLPYFMMKHFETTAKNQRQGQGQITIGGYVTYIAKCVKAISQPRMKESGGPNRVNMRTLVDMKMIEKVGRGYRFIFGRFRFPLPFNKKIDLENKRTWILVDRDGTLINHEEEEVQRQLAEMEAAARAARAGTSSEAQVPNLGGKEQQHETQPQWQWQGIPEYSGGYNTNPAYYEILQDIHTAQWNLTADYERLEAKIDAEHEENRRWRQQQQERDARNDGLFKQIAAHIFGPPPQDPPQE